MEQENFDNMYELHDMRVNNINKNSNSYLYTNSNALNKNNSIENYSKRNLCDQITQTNQNEDKALVTDKM